jgi:hypothetical protein
VSCQDQRLGSHRSFETRKVSALLPFKIPIPQLLLTGKFDSHVDNGVLVGYSSTRKAYNCYNLRLNKVVESINVKIDEMGGRELKEEENESMEQLYEEEAEDEEEVEREDEEDQTKVEDQVHRVPPKTPIKRVQKNHPSDQIIGNKDAGF